jgi:hypothetical protein
MEFHIMAIKKSSGSGIPFGNNAGRPANPGTGQLYSNGEAARLELYTATGWQNIVQEVPGVASITGTYSEATNSGTITIQGTNFVSGAIASAIGSNGVEVLASSTTYNSLVQITAVFANLSNANEPYDIKVTNPSNLFGLIPDALYVNASPVWQTASGSLGTFNEQVSITLSALSASDSDSTVTYALANGSSLPSGVTLNSATGVISGTLPDISTNTTYSFTVNATDGLNTIPRTFSITSNYLIDVEYLVVAGGGGGGGAVRGGGGGAGGYRSSVQGELSGQNSNPESVEKISVGSTKLITVGSGGNAGPYDIGNGAAAGENGQNSIFGSIVSIGGGAGGASDSQGTGRNPQIGGSGGGGFYGWTGQPAVQGTANQGFPGGTSQTTYPYGGGGGGAGQQGRSASDGSRPCGGGNGLQSSITGTATYYAGGGSSAGYPGQGSIENVAGGLGGGGKGMNNVGKTSGTGDANGTPNTGGGGGASGNGGSGVVIIAYPNTFPALSSIPGTLTYDQPTRAGYRVYRFTAGSGTITV